MAGRQKQYDRGDSEPGALPSSPPPSYPSHDQSFTLQAIFDLKSDVAKLTSAVEQLRLSDEKTSKKVGDLHDLKNKLVGGAIVLGVVISAVGGLVAWSANKVVDVLATAAKPVLQGTAPSTAPTPEPPPVTGTVPVQPTGIQPKGK
ncbi:hypothetical protein [Pandoraea sp. NE5]|uniref:hypothetical protein n=1 Tax=Pandoraea sp. NE5 TaxID=2904129 RepID=UPI0021C2E548|nr:hypothetical protein [Pandoraea sp. NE5]